MTGSGLLVVGDLATDVVAAHDRPLAPATDTPARIALLPGGSAANVAAWAADRGAATTLLARVGAESAAWHRAELERTGVRPVLRIDPDRPTTLVVCLVDASGERTMLNDRGASGALGLADWDDALLDGVAWLHLSGYLLFSAPGRELTQALLARARAAGIGASLDPASAGPLAVLGPATFLDLAAGVDLLLPNLDEARLLSGATAADQAARRLADRTGALVAVKLGPLGATLAEPGHFLGRVPSPQVTAVDTTGAGDAFAGAYLAARLAGATPLHAAERACATAAHSVTLRGARPR
ncbi:sugar/nucleoside kinase (ribokinase family) [Streptacidiphilus sp. MAP12-20]|uniref:carbohydrate kinase family protein n=1 Tax=Streptacidiphilus sp. MAP12-20 TaxID=3156299 RepID=UPI0035185FA8